MSSPAAASGAAGDAPRKRKQKDAKKGALAWKKLKVDDDFLLGLSEPGFQDIEELQDVSLLGADMQAMLARADAALLESAKASNQASGSKEKKGKKGKQGASKQSSSVDNEPEDLKERIAQLEAENARLRAQTSAAGAQEGAVAKKRKKSKAKAAKAGGALEQKEAGDVAAEPPAREASRGSASREKSAAGEPAATEVQERDKVDMSAWDDYGLDDSIIEALARQGFTAPTAIQHECMPAAIQGNADIVGAAQTGSGKTLAFGLPVINYLVKEAKELADLVPTEADDDSAADADAGADADGDAVPACSEDEAQEDDASDAEAGPAGPPALAQRPLTKSERLLAGRNKLRALVLCPTRELAMQVCNHLQAIAKVAQVRVVPIVGGISPQKQERLLSYKPPVVVATPGRLWDLMSSGHKHLSDLSHLSFLVLDEADRMELTNILEQIPRPLSEQKATAEESSEVLTITRPTLRTKLHTYVFSATLTLPDSLKAKLQRGSAGSKGSAGGASFENLMSRIQFRGRPKIADLTSANKLAEKISEAYISCAEDERDDLLYYLLARNPGRTLVFANAISGVRRASALMKLLGLPAQALHAQQQQRQRLKALDKFKADEQGILVATDVAARGLDVRNVRCVIQYQLPPSADTYIHRAGRTARAAADGLCISFVVPNEAGRFAALHRALARPPPPHFPVNTRVLKEAHARVRLAQRIDEIERAHRKSKADKDWRARHSQEIGIDLDDDDDESAGPRPKQRGVSDSDLAVQLRSQLSDLLSEPLGPRLNEKFFTGGAGHAGPSTSGAQAAHAGSAALPSCALQASMAQAQSIADVRKERAGVPTGSGNADVPEVSTSGSDKPSGHSGGRQKHAISAPFASALGLQGKVISKNAVKRIKSMSLADYKKVALEKALAARNAKKSRKSMTGRRVVGS